MLLRLHRKTFNEYTSSLAVFHVFLMCGKNILTSMVPALYRINGTLNLMIILLYIVLYLGLFVRFRVIDKISTNAYFILFGMALFVGITYLVTPNMFTIPNVLTRSRDFIAYSLPLFLLFNIMQDPDAVIKKMCKYARVLLLVGAVGFVSFFLNQGAIQADSSYSMSYGNNMLVVVLALIFDYWKNTKPSSLFLSVIATVMILLAGSRGPILCISVAYMIVLLFLKTKKWWQKLLKVCLIVAIPMVLLFWPQLIRLIISMLDALNIGSRTLERMADLSALLYDSGRSVYHDGIKDALAGKMGFGLGAFGGDRTVGLAHSFYWDLFANFGYLWGSLIIIAFIGGIVRQLANRTHNGYSDIILFFAIIIVPRGFFDGTLFSSYEFWIIIAILLNRYNVINKKQRVTMHALQ